MQQNRKKYKRIAFWSTSVFMTVVVLLLVLFGFTTPLPLPEEEGIMVNFGYEDPGQGIAETQSMAQPEPTTEPMTSEPVASEPEVKAEEEVITQDFEDAAAIEAKKEEERKKREEKERLRKEREEQERIERERKEKERREREQQEKINQVTKSAFSSGKNKDGESKSDGDTSKKGNQGSEDGDPNSNQYGDGKGLSDKGIGYSLKGRTPNGGTLPKPRYQANEEGLVVIRVTVDQSGQVTSASYQAKGSTTANKELMNAALEAARKAEFNSNFNADAFQIGTITYRFVMQ